MNTKPCTFAALMAAGLLFGQAGFAQEAWSLAKDTDGIKVYVRNVSDSPLREFKGEVHLSVTPDNVVRVLKDADAFKKWMPDVAVSELLKATETEQYHYLDNKTPWPVSNRDGVYHFTYAYPGDGSVVVRVEAVPTYVPEREGKVRIPKANGQWTLAPDAEGVNVSYQMHASPGGAIPNWLANQMVVDTPFGTLKALRTYLQSAH